MNFIETNIPGALIVEATPFSDDRGTFSRVYCQRELAEAGFEGDFVQTNHSISLKKGTIRGLHYQMPPHAEAKLVKCVRGAIFDVCVDLRRGSPTFLQWVGVELTEKNLRQFLVPEGCGHGFLTLEDHSEALYMSSAFYAPGVEKGIRFDDPLLQIEWPVEVAVATDKDRSHPDLSPDFLGIPL